MAYGDPPTDLRPHVTYLARQREALRERMNRIAANKNKHKKQAIAIGEIALGSAIAGVVQGRAGEGGAHILRMPASLVVGGALVAGGVLQAGEFSDHLINLGTGFLAEFAGNFGYGVGQRWHATGHLGLFGSGGGGGGALPPGGAAHTGADLTPHQMANLVRQVQAAG
jgi:hypothetical protein